MIYQIIDCTFLEEIKLKSGQSLSVLPIRSPDNRSIVSIKYPQSVKCSNHLLNHILIESSKRLSHPINHTGTDSITCNSLLRLLEDLLDQRRIQSHTHSHSLRNSMSEIKHKRSKNESEQATPLLPCSAALRMQPSIISIPSFSAGSSHLPMHYQILSPNHNTADTADSRGQQ